MFDGRDAPAARSPLPSTPPPAGERPRAAVFDVTAYGAAGDGRADDTAAVARAIRACAAAGGGRVRLPAGTYRTGPIELRSRVELHAEAGATVLFSRDFDDYPLTLTYYEGRQTVRCRSPLWGEGLHDVAVTGGGVFDGQGDAWRPVKRSKQDEARWAERVASGGVVDAAGAVWWPTRAAMEGEEIARRLLRSGAPPAAGEFAAARDFLRPTLLKLTDCRGVLLDGPTFRDSPAWNLHLVLCEGVTVRGVTVLNPWYAQNGDGIDLDSCRAVRVEDSHFDVGDDAICLKSGKDAEGRRRGRPTEDVVIRGCTVLHGHGAVTIGSEMSGGVRGVRVSDCRFRGTDVGLRLKTARGRGGVVEDVTVRDVVMEAIRGAAISLDMYYGGTAWDGAALPPATSPRRPADEGTPRFRGVHVRGVTCRGARRGIELRGLPEMPIEDVTFEDVRIAADEGASLVDCRGVTLRDVRLESRAAPALRCHNVRGLTLERVDAGDAPGADAEA